MLFFDSMANNYTQTGFFDLKFLFFGVFLDITDISLFLGILLQEDQRIFCFLGSVTFVPPVQYPPPNYRALSLHSKLLCKNIERASGGCK